MDVESKQTLDEGVDRLEAAIARQLALATANIQQTFSAIIDRLEKIKITVTIGE